MLHSKQNDMNNQPYISIITPVYNGLPYIKQCIENVAGQIHNLARQNDIEHFIVDGGSTDGTTDVIRKQSEAFPHIRWISEPDKGQSDAMNKGIKLAKGEVIGILNVDDFYVPGMLNEVAECMRRLPANSFMAGNCKIWDNDGHCFMYNRPHSMSISELYYNIIAKHFEDNPNIFPYNPSAYFYHKSIHGVVGYYETQDHYTMDFDFIVRLVLNADKINLFYKNAYWGNFRQIPDSKTFQQTVLGNSLNNLLATFNRHFSNLPEYIRNSIIKKPLDKLSFAKQNLMTPMDQPAAGVVFVDTSEQNNGGAKDNNWHGLAQQFLERGHPVTLSLAKSKKYSESVQNLRVLGADVVLRFMRHPHKQKVRINRLLPQSKQFKSKLVGFGLFESDHKPTLVIFCPESWSELHPWIIQCVDTQTPYMLLIGGAPSLLLTDENEVAALKSVFAIAKIILFAEEETKRLTERHLGTSLANAECINFSPKLLTDVGGIEWPLSDTESCKFVMFVHEQTPLANITSFTGILEDVKWSGRQFVLQIISDFLSKTSLGRVIGNQLAANSKVNVSRSFNAVKESHVVLTDLTGLTNIQTVLEAMSRGRVVVVLTDLPSLHDLLASFAFVGSRCEAVELLEKVWQAREKWPQIGLAAKKFVNSLAADQGYHDLYQNLLRDPEK